MVLYLFDDTTERRKHMLGAEECTVKKPWQTFPHKDLLTSWVVAKHAAWQPPRVTQFKVLVCVWATSSCKHCPGWEFQ